MLTLYAAKGTVAVASHIALEETGLTYDVRWLDFAKGDQRAPSYLAVNPKGRVPALVTPYGILTETAAILDYIADVAGALLPDDPFDRAQVRAWMSYCASTFHVNHAHKLRGARWADDPDCHASMTAKVPQTMAENGDYIESQLPDSGWCAGPYSIADIHLFTICRWLGGDGVDIAAYPKLTAHHAAMLSRPAVNTVLDAHG